MKQKLVIIILVCVFVFSTSAPAPAAPWADNFGGNYEPWMAGDTTDCAMYAAYYQNQMGYYADYWSGPYFQPDGLYYLMPYDAVFSFAGHSNAGILSFWDGQYSYYFTAIGDLAWIEHMHDILFAAWIGCYTANSGFGGNFLGMSRTMGIDSSMGFSKQIYGSQTEEFCHYFWYYCRYGMRVGSAAYYASLKAKQYWGSYGGVNSYVFDGAYTWPQDIKLTPARQGS